MSGGCSEFNRGQALRHAVAEAGRGLPSIEPGMPPPAGTGLRRRSFLLRSAGLALTVYGGAHLDQRAVEEAFAQAPADDRVLVSVFLEGGLDGMSVLAPVGDSRYAAMRPTLGIGPEAGTAFSEDPGLRWHPAAEALSVLHGEGKVTVFPAIGYSSPNQSHFTSRHFWEVGALDTREHVGWLGRYLDAHGDQDNPLQGLTLGGLLMPAVASRSVPVAAVLTAHDYSLPVYGLGGPIQGTVYSGFSGLGTQSEADPAVGQARAAVRRTARLHGQLAGFAEPSSPVSYPSDPLAVKLKGLAAMLAAGLPLRCVSVQGTLGYDSHAGQASVFDRAFRVTADTLLAFQRDLEARGLADRVLVNVWSEFGRRPAENGSGGTDHGAGGLAFLIGTRARSTMVGEFPGLAQLDPIANLRSTSDFRALYCALLEQWLGADAGPIIPGSAGLERPQILKS